LSVDVAGVPFPKIEWFKEGKSIDFDTQSDKYKLERDLNTGTWSLVISNCKIDSDSGIYKARIYNPGGECSCEGTVAVKGFAPRFIEKPEKIYALTNEVATFVAVVEGDPTPTVEWSKGKNILQDNNDIKIYYDQENDLHIMEISNCKPKDAGTYQVTAINEFGTDLAPVTLIITHNPEDVVDLKDQLKNRGGRRSVDNSNDPDWGKLKKGKAGIKDADQDPDWGKLKKVIRDKPQQEEQIKEEQVLPDRKPFVPKEFGPRDTDLETYEKKPKEKDDEGKVSDPDLKRKSAPTTETAPGGKEFTKLLVDMTVPEHKLGVFECSVSDAKAEVVWFFNDNQTDKMQTKKRFQTMSIGLFRRLAIRNPLIHESDSKVTCKWDDLETTAKLFVIDCPIKFMKGLKNQKVPKNSTVLLECQISNDLKPLAPLTFAWKKNGKPLDIETNKDKYEFTVTGDKYCLKVNDFIETDEAEYEIYLVDPEDWDISSKGKITIIGDHEQVIEETTVSKDYIDNEETHEEIEKKIKFVYKLDDCHLKKHEKGVFELKLPAREKIRWLKDGKPIETSLKYEISQIGKVCTLFVFDAGVEDEGRYTAIAETNEQVNAHMTVEDFVEILSPLKDQNLTEKDTLKLYVVISDKTEPGTWFKDGKPIELAPGVIIESLNGKHELTMPNCKQTDAGVFSFVAKEAKCECNVNIAEEPLEIVKRLQDQDGLENKQVVFECVLNKPNVPIEWMFNDLPIGKCFSPDSFVISQDNNK
jgi:hypothetical protein